MYLIHNNQPKWPPRTSKLLKAGCKADCWFCSDSSIGAPQTLQICQVRILISKKSNFNFQTDWLCHSHTTINQSWQSNLINKLRVPARLIVVSIPAHLFLVFKRWKVKSFESTLCTTRSSSLVAQLCVLRESWPHQNSEIFGLNLAVFLFTQVPPKCYTSFIKTDCISIPWSRIECLLDPYSSGVGLVLVESLQRCRLRVRVSPRGSTEAPLNSLREQKPVQITVFPLEKFNRV